MSRVVTCHHCGAPHRLVHSQDRFSCDWCGGANAVERDARARELVVPRSPDGARAIASAERELIRRRVDGARVHVEGERWIGIWHVLSERGEEFFAPAQRNPTALDRSLELPAVPLVPREEGGDWIDEAASRPEVEAAEIVAAAQASFQDSRSAVEELRLIWLPVVDLRVETAAGPVVGLFLSGADRVVLAPLPEGASRLHFSAGRLQAFALFAFTSILLGLAIADPWARAGSEAIWLLVGWTAWSQIRSSAPGTSP